MKKEINHAQRHQRHPTQEVIYRKDLLRAEGSNKRETMDPLNKRKRKQHPVGVMFIWMLPGKYETREKKLLTQTAAERIVMIAVSRVILQGKPKKCDIA